MRAISLAVRVLMVPLHVTIMWLHRLADLFERPRYRIRGGCRNNGQCCRQLLLAEHPFLTWAGLSQLVRFWMERIYPFEITETAVMDPDSGDFFRILHCRNLVDHRCREYLLRPRLCRAWPEPSSGGRPVLFKGCGFSAVDILAGDGQDVSKRRNSLEHGAEGLIRRWQEQADADSGRDT